MDRARILVVDDTLANIQILGELLRPEYHVSVALNGMAAIELASSDTPPDLILLDIMMPGLDGYQVCEALKAKEETRQIPIIFVTAINEKQSEEKGLALGAVDYITKPFTPSIVLARVQTHLALYNQTRLLRILIQERTEELDKARREAEAANKAKSTFLANMSHELRTPLNGIMGMTQLLMESRPSEEQQKFLEDTQQSSDRLLTMVNDLLELSNAEAENIHLEPSLCNLRQNLNPVLLYYRDRAAEKGLDFDSSFSENVPQEVYADCSRLRQVLINLLNNAIQYTNEGSIQLKVNALGVGESEPEGQINLIFTVADTGVGVPEEHKDHIFEPFAIGEDFMTKRYCGAGLGLSISKRLVNRMGGYIWLETSQENGSVFNFTISCTQRAANADENADAQTASSSEA